MAERQLRQILDQLASASPPRRYKAKGAPGAPDAPADEAAAAPGSPAGPHPEATRTGAGGKTGSRPGQAPLGHGPAPGQRNTAHARLASLLHPKLSASPSRSASGTGSPPRGGTGAGGLSSVRLAALLDILSFTGKRTGPPALDLGRSSGPGAEAADLDMDMDEGVDGGGEAPCALAPPVPGHRSSARRDVPPRIIPINDIAVSPDASSLNPSCTDMDRHWTPHGTASPPPHARSRSPPWRARRGRRVRFSDDVVVMD